jgi:DNA-binding IclR family transcriptional regulator
VLRSRLAEDSRIVRTPPPTTARDRPPEEAAEDTSFARGLRLLLMVADRGGIRADELGSLLEMPVSTVYRYLRTLGEFGFVDRRGGQFRLGPRLHIGTGANVSSERLIRHADAALRMLADETGETAVVVRRIGLSCVSLHQVESEQPLRVTLEPGSMSPLHVGALGKVLLAYAPADVLEDVLAQDGLRVPEGVPTEADLRASLAAIVASAMTTSVDQPIAGAVAMAVPLFREDGIVGAVALLGPASRCDEPWRAAAGRLIREAAREIEASLAEDDPG